MKKAVAYYRVSTQRQGRSGLGLEAQQEAVRRYAEREGYTIIEDYQETESGGNDKRPKLLAALVQCRKEQAMLIIATLSRLGRDLAFIANLTKSKIPFVAVDNPTANELTIHIIAAVDQQARRTISIDTKRALAAAKMRGVQLGQYGKEVLGPQNAAAAVEFADRTRPAIEAIRLDGFKSIRAIVNEMNRRNIPTYRAGSQWHYSSVYAILKRIKSTKKKVAHAA